MNNPQPWWLTWPVAEVAAAILPLFAQFQEQNETTAMTSTLSWLRTGEYKQKVFDPTGNRFRYPDARAVAEAWQVLEHGGLLMRRYGEYPDVGLTRKGWHAVQTNTVRQHLGLGDAPPTA